MKSRKEAVEETIAKLQKLAESDDVMLFDIAVRVTKFNDKGEETHVTVSAMMVNDVYAHKRGDDDWYAEQINKSTRVNGGEETFEEIENNERIS